MHLQRVATMAAATATAQQISADVDSHEQFAKELRSYRGQAAGGGQRRVTKPSWESDVGGEGTFETGYPPSGPEYEGMPGELMWQTSGAPHQLHIAPAVRQPASGGLRKKDGLTRRQKVPVSGLTTEQTSTAGANADMQPSVTGYSDPQGWGTPPPLDPPDMPGINRAGLLNLRNKLRSRPALMSPPTNAFSAASLEPPPGMPPAIGSTNRLGNQENLASPYPISPDLTSGFKREMKERRKVVPPRQSQQPFRVDPHDDSASASSSASSSSSSSSSSGAMATRAGPKKVSGQGAKATALRAAPCSRSTKDGQAESAQLRAPAQLAGPSEFSIPGGGVGMAASPGDLSQCEGCGRSFNPKAFEVHSRICAKVFQRQRKGFDAEEAKLGDTGGRKGTGEVAGGGGGFSGSTATSA
ncbi:TPA: hypothetical protein ACH3X3_012864 [Trebouxia sp. C0006]